MKTNLKLNTMFLILIIFLFPLFSFAQPISSNELIGNAKNYDGKEIAYAGEAVGDVMLRKENAWVNIHDGDNAIGVWMSGSFAKEINYTGSHKSIGDKLEVAGIFHRACPEHGGDMDIHANDVRKIKDGRMISEKTDPAKKGLALILWGVLVLIWILTLFRRK